MTDRPEDVIAFNLPTFAECYRNPMRVDLPSMHRLRDASRLIVGALKTAGFEVRSIASPTDLEKLVIEWRDAREAILRIDWSKGTTNPALLELWERVDHAEAALMAHARTIQP